ncbi:hypothetical protein [Burkholderia aenigmatica]|uniref:hypothetical protein n=1 Tax=Burkholderia aenigmatica TaxID=2015348 RepID=UPI001178273A|nr:hypothetical protein [Burkholderia aenigmatica]
MKKYDRPREGTCKLTGAHGRFVKSHLIPLALTRLSRTGEKYIEAGIGLGIKSRANSWYDDLLVTRDGEDILAEIDARGIEELRRHKLVWSGWDTDENIASLFVSSEQAARTREIAFAKTDFLQLFFISLLWRAAASTREEFADIKLSTATLEDLRVRVIDQAPGAFDDYPVQLFQVTTLGIPHNRAPRLETKLMPLAAGTGWGSNVDYVRFYFDGLAAHVHIPQGTSMEPEYLQTCLGLGPSGSTIVFGHTFEESRAWANFKEMVVTVTREEKSPPSPYSSIARAVREYLEILHPSKLHD